MGIRARPMLYSPFILLHCHPTGKKSAMNWTQAGCLYAALLSLGGASRECRSGLGCPCGWARKKARS
jgi:hypothetical protein